MSDFITIQSGTTTGALGSLSRSVVLATRETVAGYTADPVTGLYKINKTDLATFITNNSAQYGLINALNTVFNQTYTYEYVYILSTGGSGTALTSAMLNQANIRPRDWSFITLVSQNQGYSTDSTTYFADLLVIATWAVPTLQKIVVHTYSTEESIGVITLPAQLALGGTIGINNNVKTIVSNSKHTIYLSNVAYDNIALAWLAYCINSAISRSWGSLSDAHDFAYVASDNYSVSSRSIISNASLGQYNGAKDRAGSLFVYDTQMNDANNPPLSKQIESLAATYYIDDYEYVLVHNTFQVAGQLGLPNDDAGIQNVVGVVTKGLKDCFALNLILGKADNSMDATVASLTAAQVDTLSANWRTTGIWPAGVITATIKPFSAGHYITLRFNFT